MAQEKDLLKCSIDELLTEKQNAIEARNIDRYRECDELISTWAENIAKKLDIEDMKNDLELNSFESTLGQAE